MKKYKPLFEEKKVERKNNAIYLADEISIQNPFNINELNGTTFSVLENWTDSYKQDREKYNRIVALKNNINDEFNDVRQILYNYTLIKVMELQEEVDN